MSLARLQSLSAKDPLWKDLLGKIVGRIRTTGVPCQVWIFGSFTRDQLTEASDLDLAVILEDQTKARVFLDRLYSAGTLSPWPLDLLVLPRQEFEHRKEIGGACMDIAREGIELHPNWRLS